MGWGTRVVRRSVQSLLLACSLWGLGAGPGMANAPSLACANRDVQILILLEKHGERHDIPADRLAIAASTMQIARDACKQGLTDVGMAIYDLIHPQVILVPSNLRSSADPRD